MGVKFGVEEGTEEGTEGPLAGGPLLHAKFYRHRYNDKAKFGGL